ncbi:hypothetical protein FOI68_09010 [Brevibacillus sp. LEMMJ03]|uniref:hypothetical protein n=1 Tax=Brevibacillus sp. LEMMJ03 TaxID=2595056 RepID=UPI00118074D6|nr:hypothetical protein [Brevibacillus sp. LEMMJ03]TRY26376.1 hypothetical protein FOI68_09010 [Brevibacillus sp. LEMMJ03]
MRYVLIVTFFLCSALLGQPLQTTAAAPPPDLLIAVSVGPNADFWSTLSIRQPDGLAQVILRSPTGPAGSPPEPVRATVTIGSRSFLYGYDGRLYDQNRQSAVHLTADAAKELDGYVHRLEQVHFGKPLDWSEVRRVFKRMGYATVIDLETGERFRVQRRAGSRHADVQPLTKEDTRIMKQIYQGRWSWKRRAILVEVNGTYFAASMHGMPHGAGAIRGNQFPGHFCIHFMGSSTHRRKEPDPSHSLMILKASGKLPETVMAASPEQLVDYFLTSLNEHDLQALRMTTDGFALPSFLQGIDSVKRIEEIRPGDTADALAVEIPVRVDYVNSEGATKQDRWVFHLYRTAPWARWKITGVFADE